MSQKEYDDSEGERPTEEVGVAECSTEPQRCEVPPGERDGPPHESEFPALEELQDQFQAEDIPVFLDPDGMPAFGDGGDINIAHPFTIDTVVCVEDNRKYVESFVEEQKVSSSLFMNSKFKLVALSNWDENGQERKRRTYLPEKVVVLWGKLFVKGSVRGGQTVLTPVRPIRLRCKHYKRQCLAIDGTRADEVGHKVIFRNCTVRRSIGGAFMSLRDEAIYACDYRDPPDVDSVTRELDKFDNEKLTNRPDLVKVPMFGLDGAETQLKSDKEKK